MAAVSPTYLAGYVGAITVDAIDVPYTNGSVNHSVSTFDATNANGGGAAHPERAIESLKGSFTVPHVFAGTSIAIVPGSVYAATFYRKSSLGHACNILITGADEAYDVKGGSIVNIAFESQGAITRT